MKRVIRWFGKLFKTGQGRATPPEERMELVEKKIERILIELARHHADESKAYGTCGDFDTLYRDYRKGMQEDLLDLMAFVATWDGVVERGELLLIRQAAGEPLTEQVIFDRARKVAREMEQWEPEYGGSGMIRVLSRYDSKSAFAYIEALLEAGALLYEGDSAECSRLALELMAIYLGAQRTHALAGRLSRHRHSGMENENEISGGEFPRERT